MRILSTWVAVAALVALAGCAETTKTESKVDSDTQNGKKVEIVDRAGLGRILADTGNTVYFDYDKAVLRPEALTVLGGVAKSLQRYPEIQITIAGHADERGTREYNLALGNLRATAVRNYLVSLGVPAQRLDTVSYGKERPAVAGSTEESWSKNRRAVAEVE